MTYLPAKNPPWKNEGNPLGPPSNPSTATPIDATSMADLETRVEMGLETVSNAAVLRDGTGMPSSVVSDSSQSGGSSDDVVHVSKYINAGVYASTTAAVQAAHDALPTNGGTLQLPAGTFTLDNVSLTKSMTLRGVFGGTYLLPGASGTILTANYAFNGALYLQDVCIGEAPNATSPNRSYATPMLDFQNFTGYLGLRNVYARITGTGTIFRLHACSNLGIKESHINSGQYGVAFVVDKDVAAFQADTISFESVIVEGLYFAIFRPESGTFTFNWRQSKAVTNSAATILDHSLSTDAALGATTITLQTGQGASWAIDDSVYIEGDFATDSVTRTGGTAEVNRVTNVAGDVLTLARPLQYAHGTNSNAFTVQVLRGGVGLSLSSNLKIGGAEWMHFEGQVWAVVDYGTLGAKWDGCTYSTNRFLRIAGNTQDFEIGRTLCSGRGGENYLIDVPAFNASNTNFDRFILRGPWIGTTPSVLENGVGRVITTDPPGSVFGGKHYRQDDVSGGVPRRTFHSGIGATGEIHLRGGNGAANPTNWQIRSDGTLLQGNGARIIHRNAQSGSTYTATTSDRYIACTATNTTAITITLPGASTAGAGFLLTIKDEKGSAGTNNITISRAGTDLIDGSTTLVINTNFGIARLISTGAGWAVI